MAGSPDPRPVKRVRDRLRRAQIEAKLREPICVVCKTRKTDSAHHGYKAGQGGDDVAANLFGVCGNGTTLCHGLLEKRDPDALRVLGEHVMLHRFDFIEYLQTKLSTPSRPAPRAARAWLERHMFVESV